MTYQTEFPDFPEATMPAMFSGFEDTSWHNDACPSFEHDGLGLRLHVDYADKAMSEIPNGSRFGLYQLVRCDDGRGGLMWDWPSNIGDDDADPKLIESDDWAEVAAVISARLEGAK
jgi:hypothetical protein